MFLRRPLPSSPFSTVRHHSSAAKPPKLFSKIRTRYRPKAIQQAQQALRDYLHEVRTIPYIFADNITNNSVTSLSGIISEIKFSPSNFSKSLHKFFRYHAVNEFEFFFESIGIDVNEFDRVLPAGKLFLSEDLNLLNVACTLYSFGIPWNRLGILYTQQKSIFDKTLIELKQIWGKYLDSIQNCSCLIGICLSFPQLLNSGSEIEKLFDNLKNLVINFDFIGDIECNVDAWITICRKIRLFYDLGCEKPDIWEMIGGCKRVLIRYPEEVLAEKIDYFRRFRVTDEEIVTLLLVKPEVFALDLKSPVFCVSGILKHFGLDQERLDFVFEKYPYVFGRNKLVNLPNVMRALDLNQWFFDKIKDGDHDHDLLSSYAIDVSEDLDRDFDDGLMRIQASVMRHHALSKLEFLHGIGYGENGLTVNVLRHMHGSRIQLQARFDCLIRNGIGFSNLCKIVSSAPKILNQDLEFIEKKVAFLHEIGLSVNYLEVFPAYLCYNLEKRIKPRYRFHAWLNGIGACEREYSLPSIISTSEISFISRLYKIHRAAPKQWLEIFMNHDYDSFREAS